MYRQPFADLHGSASLLVHLYKFISLYNHKALGKMSHWIGEMNVLSRVEILGFYTWNTWFVSSHKKDISDERKKTVTRSVERALYHIVINMK